MIYKAVEIDRLIEIPSGVKTIIEKLETAEFEAFAVGGCVRDIILEIEPADWDITTSATPQQVKTLFSRTIDTGIAHGTVTVLIDGTGYEVTTYRIDGEYKDNRRPEAVAYTDNLIEDLKRRDFTINAMAYNPTVGIVDAFNGIEDLSEGLIRSVGLAKERFNEDALRMLRAIRFAARFGFEIHKDTKEAIQEMAPLIQAISAERILVELTKTLISDHPEYFEQLVELRLIHYIMPEYEPVVGLEQDNPNHVYTVDRHTMEALKYVKAHKVLRWSVLLHDIGKGYTKSLDLQGVGHFYGHVEKSVALSRQIMNRLKFDNLTKNRCLKLIEFHDHRISPKPKSVRRLLNQLGVGLFEDYIAIREADIMAQNSQFREKRLKELESIVSCYENILENAEAVTIKDLAISGKELLEMGVFQGQLVGKILSDLLEEVIEEPERNTLDYLSRRAKDMMDLYQ